MDTARGTPPASLPLDEIVEAVAFAAERLLLSSSWRATTDEVLGRLGVAAGVSRAYIVENATDAKGRLTSTWISEWTGPGILRVTDDPNFRTASWEISGFGRWSELLSRGDIVRGAVADLPADARLPLEQHGVVSLASFPVFVGGGWWGAIGFDDCVSVRDWTGGELGALRAAATVLGAAIQRQRVDEQAVAAEKQYRRFIEHIPAVTYLDVEDGEVMRVGFISPQIEELLGYPGERFVEDPNFWFSIVHPEDRARVDAAAARTNEESFDLEYRMIAADGRAVWVHDISTEIEEAAPDVPRTWQGFLTDVSARRDAEEQLARALDVEREGAQRLRALDEMKNTFLQAVSHDLRTPLAAILGLAITLERGDVKLEANDTRDLAGRIAENARKLDRLVTNLLDMDRLARGIITPKLASVDLGELVRRVVDESDLIGPERLTVDVRSVVISLDASKVERIIENLLANTARHTPTNAHVWVSVRPVDDGAQLSVEDSGVGVPAEIRETIFEPFQQGPNAPQHSPGVGVGLTLVRRFAGLHGGRAWIEEREGGGASFQVFLPETSIAVLDRTRNV